MKTPSFLALARVGCLLAAVACFVPTWRELRAQQPNTSSPDSKSFDEPVLAPNPVEDEGSLDEPVRAPNPVGAVAQRPDRFDPRWLSALQWRPIGPAAMGGRIVDLAVVESDPNMFYVATASGGLFKTTNNGTTFAPVFERENTVSIGDVCVAPSDPDIVWVGTGEHNARNSVSWGDGVYKSADGGKSWRHMGLKESFQIGRIVIHPQNPNVVYVGALGRLWGPNEERGVFKTSDGGRTWEKVLYVDDKTGCVDIAVQPGQPETLIAAMYERQRDEFDSNDPAKRWGPGGGIYKTTDGGENWTRLTKGLPSVKLGRIGLCYYRANPRHVYAIIETEKIGQGEVSQAYMGIAGVRSNNGAVLRQIVPKGPAAKAGLRPGDVVVRVKTKVVKSYNDLVLAIRRHKPGDKVKMLVRRGDKEIPVEVTFDRRPSPKQPPAKKKRPGGRSSPTRKPYAANLGGQRENAQELQGDEGFQTGGIYKSTDGGETWMRINSLNPRPFYYSQIHVDPSDENHIFVLGISLHYSSDNGETFRQDAGRGVHPDHHALWIDPRDGRHVILGGDGGLFITYDRSKTWDFAALMAIGQFYHVTVDNRPLYRVYGGLQDNGSWGGPSRKRGRAPLGNEDWGMVGWADGFICAVDPDDPDLVYYEGQNGMMSRVNLRTGERARIRPAPEKGRQYRFNWKTPYILSPHNPRIYYCAANYVFRSFNRGSNLKRISPEISRTKRGSATALAQSPRDADLLFAGTDDGALWVTWDGGHEWTDITKNLTGLKELPGPRHVATIECSRFEAGRAYVALDGHRSDDDDPYLFVTEDYGKSWRSLRSNLPAGSTRCLREDVENADLLYAGTEFAIWCSVDRGKSWTRLNNNLPTVAIHEIAVHPTAGEIVAGTHGRSIWILDVTPIRQLTREVRTAETHLFQPQPAVKWAGALNRFRFGHRRFTADNAGGGARIYYFLGENAKKAELKITDLKGDLVRTLRTQKKPGLHSEVWDLRRLIRRGGRLVPGPAADSANYLVTLTVDGKDHRQEIKVQSDPDYPAAMLMEELEAFEAKQRRMEIE